MILLTYFNDSKLCSQTQPGRGIRKIVDLFHNLSDLLGKADKHAAETNLDPAELEEINIIDFLGLTEEEIDDERKEWVDSLNSDFGDNNFRVSVVSDATSLLNFWTRSSQGSKRRLTMLKILTPAWLL